MMRGYKNPHCRAFRPCRQWGKSKLKLGFELDFVVNVAHRFVGRPAQGFQGREGFSSLVLSLLYESQQRGVSTAAHKGGVAPEGDGNLIEIVR